MKERIFFILHSLGPLNCAFLTVLFILISLLEIIGIGLIIPLISLLFDENSFSLFENFDLKINFDYYAKEQLLSFLLIIFILIYLLKTILFIYVVNKKNKIAFNLQKKFSNAIFTYFLNLPYNKFINQHSSNALKIITQTTASATSAYILPIILITSEVFIIIFISAMLMTVDLVSTSFIILIFLTGIFIISRIAKRKNFRFGTLSEIYHAKRVKQLIETLKSYREILIYGKFNFFRDNFTDSNNQNITAVEKHTSWLEYPRALLEFLIIFCAIIFVLLLLQNDISTKEIITKIGIFVIAGLRLLPSSTRITNAVNSIRFGRHSFETIYKLLSNKKIKKIKKVDNKYSLKFNIVFKNLFYSHIKGKKHYILKNLNFEIKKNHITAIYGKSGSGKSTIINLILGFINPHKGKIFVDGKNLQEIKYELRNNIGYVPQETFLLDQSLKENIAFGENKNQIDLIKLKKCLIQADIYNFAQKLPKKFNTITGENGVRISGGEKQRIGIARALYNSPEILIFDEPTSSLDKNTEQKVLSTIKKLRKTKTIIVVSHSSKIKKIADKIIELN
ncbi:MAG: ABC transporter ATP-binding protein [Flavobacteriales bacterium TMED288]|nr:MAG: ABC transporter ATP-binding protein [Flavobacteriales bacterium TMED288]